MTILFFFILAKNNDNITNIYRKNDETKILARKSGDTVITGKNINDIVTLTKELIGRYYDISPLERPLFCETFSILINLKRDIEFD